MEAKARAGMSTGGLAYGFRSEPCEGGQRVLIDEVKGATVRRIFAEYEGGASLRTLAETLNREGIDPPRGSRTVGAGSWQVSDHPRDVAEREIHGPLVVR